MNYRVAFSSTLSLILTIINRVKSIYKHFIFNEFVRCPCNFSLLSRATKRKQFFSENANPVEIPRVEQTKRVFAFSQLTRRSFPVTGHVVSFAPEYAASKHVLKFSAPRRFHLPAPWSSSFSPGSFSNFGNTSPSRRTAQILSFLSISKTQK